MIENLITKMTTRSTKFLLVVGLIYMMLFIMALTKANVGIGNISNTGQHNSKIMQQTVHR